MSPDGGTSGGSTVTASVKTTPDGASPAAAATPEPGAPAAAKPPVEVARARAAAAATELQSVGTLASDEAVAIAAEVAGRIAEIGFKEGEPVKQGTVLVRFDDSLARADLSNVEANLRLAESNFQRATSLSQSGAGTQRSRDEAQAALDTGRAAVELARVRLDKTQIRAPFDGTVGLRTVSVGAYAQVGQELVNLEKIDTLKLDFRLPEMNLRDVSVGMSVEIRVDAFPDRRFEGRVYAIDPLIDVNGRALKIRARLENPGNVLRPGLFARVLVHGASRGDVVMVPEGAIVPRGGDVFVYRIDNGRVVQAKVTLGERRSGEVEILEGLAADASVVVAGHSRLRDGVEVEVVQPGRPS